MTNSTSATGFFQDPVRLATISIMPPPQAKIFWDEIFELDTHSKISPESLESPLQNADIVVWIIPDWEAVYGAPGSYLYSEAFEEIEWSDDAAEINVQFTTDHGKKLLMFLKYEDAKKINETCLARKVYREILSFGFDYEFDSENLSVEDCIRK